MNTLAGKPGTALPIASLTLAGVANAGSFQPAHSKKGHIKTGYSKTSDVIRHDFHEYPTALEIRSLYGEVKVSESVRDCWDEPVYHRCRGRSSATDMLAGGLIGGVIGYQTGGWAEYRRRECQRVMPYDPGNYINMRIEFAPVI
jgi:hypothetical protein